MLHLRHALAVLLPRYARGRLLRFRFFILGVLIFTLCLFIFTDVSPFDIVLSDFAVPGGKTPPPLLRPPKSHTNPDDHPISTLIHDANLRYKELLTKRSLTIEDAAKRYRERRGRHPPPGFDAWFAQAQKDGAIIVEDFFDRIHHDINPFWAVGPGELRKQTVAQPQMIKVRNGKAKFITDDPGREPWIQLWTALVKEMMPHLPDLNMVVNIMDESRILVPWDKMKTYVEVEQAARHIIHPTMATSTYSGLKDLDKAGQEPHDPAWIVDAQKYWDYFRETCPPDSPGRNVSAIAPADVPIEYPSEPGPYMYKGFVQNFTQAQDPCLQPHLRGMHGTFIESVSMSTAQDLFPIFGGSKLSRNNEILIPGAMYLSGREFYNGGRGHGPDWQQKVNGLIWRGTASGGRNKEGNWWHFHRHRWVQMMNATTISAVEAGDKTAAQSFDLLPKERYSIPAQLNGTLGSWLSNFSDVALVNLECGIVVKFKKGIWPFWHDEKRKDCVYTSPLIAIQPSLPMKKQYNYKFLPDVDGNSFSARWRAFLQSTSMPLKATIYAEWHDDRMVPWVHFVPFDNSFGDIYAIMDYFLNGHDEEAEAIAAEGKKWADQVYRRADMKLYVWRLLLEYARVVDDSRDYLAFVGDLLEKRP